MGTRLGRYDVIRTLARGTLTDLLLGRASGEAGFQRHVAIKLLRQEHTQDAACLDMFVNEARLAAALHHHNIVQVLDIGDEGGQPFFAMEYVHGVDLRTLLNHLGKRGEQVPLQHVVSVIAAAAAALHHAHEQRGADGQPLGIVHRQVTPANILVGFDGNVKIVDFGIAKAAIKRMQTGVGVLKGSAPYMAPEQCAGRTVDRRSDVFALGIVLYELVTVRRLFKGANEFLTMSAVVNAEVPRPSQYRRDVPAELEAVMLTALSRDPLARYQTAGDMAEALDKVARQVGVGASTTAIANYMKLQFGERKEPWLEPTFSDDPDTTAVDFDGAASGLAPPPNEAVRSNAIPKTVAATKSSPIAQARTVVLAPRPKRPSEGDTRPLDPAFDPALDAPTTVGEADVPSPVSSRAVTTTGEIEDDDLISDEVATELDAAKTVPALQPPPRDVRDAGTTVPALPPPPPEMRVKPVAKVRDATAIVEPLAVVVARAATVTTERSRTLLWIGVGATLLVAIVATIVLWPSSELEATPAAGSRTSAAPTTPTAAPPAAAQRSAMEMTARDYEAARSDAGAADIAVEVDAVVEPAATVEPDPAIAVDAVSEPGAAPDDASGIEIEPEPPIATPQVEEPPVTSKRTVKKPVVKKRAVKKKAAKKKSPATTKPKWNPDDLFLGD